MQDAIRNAQISIHALLAESDAFRPGPQSRTCRFLSTLSLRRATNPAVALRHANAISIHALLAESDMSFTCPPSGHPQFLSTLSLRRATCRLAKIVGIGSHFYPRSPCGERPWHGDLHWHRRHFYPRSPCGERLGAWLPRPAVTYFYPRSPCGERPQAAIRNTYRWQFLSTLSLRRATAKGLRENALTANFYPRSPCGERLQAMTL